MRSAVRLLAQSTVTAANNSILKSAPMALLPPIPLYRRVLRAHRKFLLTEQRALGDSYVKAEFRHHQKIENPIHIIGFLTEWQMYVQAVEGDSWKDAKMDKSKIDKMSDQQIAQMYELMQAIRSQELEENDPEYISPQAKDSN